MRSKPGSEISDEASAPANGHAVRSASTRAKLIDATIACLFEQGYAATTTVAVARRARVSRGAMLHQFPTRVDLIIATAEHIVRDQDQRRRALLRSVPRGVERLHAITQVAWETMNEPASLALTEIMLGSRSDPDLSSRIPSVMHDIEERLNSGPLEVTHDLGITDDRAVQAMIRLHLAAMRGLIIEQLFQQDRRAVDEAFKLLSWYKQQIVGRLLAEGSQGTFSTQQLMPWSVLQNSHR
ncbi:TetR/AcrR family transcriptional regulator [Sphingomonas mucosissima]|uniref:HTH-type transcriptional regulator BetI n=1 Tax=Sphingomonas mucosissima TaxID=370959 RepID=A0A245ZE27_9SPHN|nr:TetR/AcrR family transcriptional regulator [Sphingomonas mucosissima]OWK27987.1 HTH-type transcriptional regulator BetI [Sphingomonas mucosissima]